LAYFLATCLGETPAQLSLTTVLFVITAPALWNLPLALPFVIIAFAALILLKAKV
jgi:hypothetical protein